MRAAGSCGLLLRDVIKVLSSEGWQVRPHHVRYALSHSGIDQPKKYGGWCRYTERHVNALRRYLAERSRSQPRRAGK